MKRPTTMIGLLFCLIMIIPAVLPAGPAVLSAGPAVLPAGPGGDEAAKIFVRGTELLKKGDFDGALKAYGEAARADSETVKYRQQFMLLRKVMKLRTAISKQEDPKKWQKMAVTLRNYYYSHRLYPELLNLAQKMYERKKSPASATLLADAQLILGKNEAAVRVLQSLNVDNMSLHSKVLLGVGLGRLKKVDEASALLKKVNIPDGARPRFLYDVARLQVLCGNLEGGMATLTTALESTSPKGLESFKNFIRNTADFQSLPAPANLAAVLKTESKVKESACSSGSSCGSCPKRGSCSGAKKK